MSPCLSDCLFLTYLYLYYRIIIIINIDKTNKEERCPPKWKVRPRSPPNLIYAHPPPFIVDYWRNKYQRMNKERFLAANTIALITHTLVRRHFSL